MIDTLKRLSSYARSGARSRQVQADAHGGAIDTRVLVHQSGNGARAQRTRRGK